MDKSAWWSVPVSVALGIPMYSNAASIIPIVQALLESGQGEPDHRLATGTRSQLCLQQSPL
jgi:hypothetical protein